MAEIDQIMRALALGTEFLYSKDGPNFGEFGGCGESSQILEKAARILGIRDVKFRFGYARIKGEEDEMIAHAWLEVDGAIFDPSALIWDFEVLEYTPHDPCNPDYFQSDLKECLIDLDLVQVRKWAVKTAQVMKEVLE